MLTPWLLCPFWVSCIWAPANKGIWSAVSWLHRAGSSIFLTSLLLDGCLAQKYFHVDLPSSAAVSWFTLSSRWIDIRHGCVFCPFFGHSQSALATGELSLLGRGPLRASDISPPTVPLTFCRTDLADKAAWLSELPVSSWQPPESLGSRWVMTCIPAKKAMDRDLPISRRMGMTAKLGWKARI